MWRKIYFAFTFIGLLIIGSHAFAQEQIKRNYTKADFINIDGSNLNDKVERAYKQFKNSNQGNSVWIAYHFSAREGVSFGPFTGMIHYDNGIKLEKKDDPASAAVFLLTDATGTQPKFTKIKTLSLSEPYVFENRQVYWLGDVDVGQSLTLLESTMRADKENKELAHGALHSIAVHNSPRVVPLLKEIATNEADEEIRRSAISNLARVKTPESLDALIALYDSISVDSLKVEIIGGIARNDSRKAADKLLSIAKNDPNPKLRQRAIRRLSTSRGSGIWIN